MKYLLGMSLLVTGIAFASPCSYKEKGDTLQQVQCKKKKKKGGCGCGHHASYKKDRFEVS